MEISAPAGKPAPKNMLVDLARLEREYYVQTFLAAEFSQAERHLRRLGKVASLEATKSNEHLNFAR